MGLVWLIGAAVLEFCCFVSGVCFGLGVISERFGWGWYG